MNPDKPSREEIEAKLTALLLGELPAAEAELLRWTISQDPELQKLHSRLLLTVGLVREIIAHPAEASAGKTVPRQLSDERRRKLLAHFKTPRPRPQELFWLKRIKVPRLVPTLAVVAIAALLAALSIPNFVKSRSTSQANATINNLRQIDGAISEWALETKKSPTDVPTEEDLKPYLYGGKLPQPVMGEKYVLGSASEPTKADIDAKWAKKELGTLAEKQLLAHGQYQSAKSSEWHLFGGAKDSRDNDQIVQLSADGNMTVVDKSAPQELASVDRAMLMRRPVAVTPLPSAPPPPAEIVLPKTEPPPVASAPGAVYSLGVVGYANVNAGGGVVDSSQNNALQQRQQNVSTVNLGSANNNSSVPATAPSDSLAFGDAAFLNGDAGGNSGGAGGFGGFGGGMGGGGGGSRGGGRGGGNVGGSIGGTAVPVEGVAGSGRRAAAPLLDSAALERISQASNDKTAVGTLVQDGKVLYGMGKFDEAEAKLKDALKLEPDNQKAYYYLSLDQQANYAREEQNRTTPAQDSMVQVANAWSPSLGVRLPIPNPNASTAPATPNSSTTLAWNDSGTDRVRTENQANDGWQGGALFGPVATSGSPPAAAMPGERLPGVSMARSDVAAEQNQVVGGGRFYRSTAGETSAEQTPALGDMPAAGFAFIARPNTPAPVVAPPPSNIPARQNVELAYDLGAPRNMAETAKELPKSGSGTLAWSSADIHVAGVVANNGTLALDDLQTTRSGTSGESDGLNLGAAKSESREQNALTVQFANANPQQAAPVLKNMFQSGSSRGATSSSQNTPFQQRMQNRSISTVPEEGLSRAGLAPIAAQITNSIALAGDLRPTAATGTSSGYYNFPSQTASEPVLERAKQMAEEDRPIQIPSQPAPVPQLEILTRENAFSTFSLNVSDVSFKLAEASLQKGQMPEAASIRSEEFINAFDYRDPEAAAGQPIAFASERAYYPFAHNRDLLRFSVKTAAAGRAAGRPLNLVLLLDNSGSMERADRVEIIREALRVLATQLQPQDTVSVVTFARTARLWADGVSGDKAGETLEQVGGITPEGGTNLEEAMRLAYEAARRHYLANGMNRVVLLTDGAANLGNVDPGALKQKVEANRKQGIALDCFGIGWEGFNDDLLEQLSSNGDGRYAFLNSPVDAASEFAAKLAGALQVAASDVKVQVEFNPRRVVSYRQIGYAKHQLTKEQFRDNTVDAAEIAAQEAGNALYTVETKPDGTGPIATVRVRYKVPGTMDYQERSWEVPYTGNAVSLEQSSPAMRLAATASAFSEWLASSPFAQEVSPDELLNYLSGVPAIYGADPRPKQLEWMIRQAKSLSGK